MALLFADSFCWPQQASGNIPPMRYTGFYRNDWGSTWFIVQSSGGPFNSRFLQLKRTDWGAVGGQTVWKQIAQTPTTIMVQFGYRVFEYTAAWYAVRLVDNVAGATQITVLDVNGQLYVQRGSTTIATASAMIAMNTWHLMELKVTIDASNGVVVLKADGVTLVNASGLNTKNTANAFVNTVYFGGTTSAGSGTTDGIGISDVIIMDTTGSYCNDLLGPRRVQALVPTSEGNYHMSTPSSGTRASTVDEIPPATSPGDYNTMSAIDDTDTFVFPDLGANQNNIDAVVCSPYATTTDAGAASIKGVARSNSVDGYGPILAVPASENWLQSPIYVDPNTNAPFTLAAFNAAEFGYKRG